MAKVQVKSSDGKVMFEIENHRSYRKFRDVTTKELYIHLDGELRLFTPGIIRYDRTLAHNPHKQMREKHYEEWYNKEYQEVQEVFRRDTQQDYMNNTGYYPTDEVMDECERNLFRTWCKGHNYQPIF